MQTSTNQSYKHHIVQTIRLSLPLIFSQLTVMAMSTVDTMMSAGLGSVTLAAVGAGSSVWAMVILLLIGIFMAVTPVISEMVGSQRMHAIAPFIRQVMWTALFLGTVFIFLVQSSVILFDLFGTQPEVIPHAAAYVKAIGWGVLPLTFFVTFRYLADGLAVTMTTMYISFFGLLMNIPLNYILMYGKLGMPALGAAGCGYASAIIITVQMFVYATVIHRHKSFAALKIFAQIDRVQWKECRNFIMLGFPVGIAMFAEVSFFSAVTLLSSKLAVEVAAAHQIALNLASLVFMIPLGLSMGITVRVGNALGRNNPVDIRRAGMTGILLVVLTQSCSAILMIIAPGLMIGFYVSQDTEVFFIASGMLFYAAIFQLSDGIQVAAAGSLRGIKDMNYVMFSTVFSFWVIGFISAWYLCFQLGMGADGLWIGLIVGLSSVAILNWIRFHIKTHLKPADLLKSQS